MAADVERIVDLIFRATDRITNPLRSMDKAASAFGDKLRSVLELLHHLNGAGQILAPMFGAIKEGVVGLNRRLEETQLKIAGTLKAFSFVETFEEGQREASKAFDIIRRQAAALPGEVEDYIAVFEYGLPKAVEASIASVDKIADVTSRFAAVAIAQGVDAQQAGMDLMRMLGGQAGMDVRMWTSLAPLIGKSAQEFNKLTAAERWTAVAGVLDKYDDLLGSFGNTLSAVEGTLTSQTKDVIQVATKPLFDVWRDVLITVSDYLERNESTIRHIASVAGGALVQGIVSARDMMVDLWGTAQRLYSFLEGSGVMDGLRSLVALATGALDSASSSGFGGIIAAVVTGFGAATGVVISALEEFYSYTLAMTSVFSSLYNMAELLFGALTPLTDATMAVGQFLGELAAHILPPFMAGLNAIMESASKAFALVSDGVRDFLDRMRKPVMRFADVLARIWGRISDIVGPAVEALGLAFNFFANLLGDQFAEIIDKVSQALEYLLDAIDTIVGWVNAKAPVDSVIGAIGDGTKAAVKDAVVEGPRTGGFALAPGGGLARSIDTDRLGRLAAEQQAQREAERIKRMADARKPPGVRGSSTQVFDFRNSRFSIEQRFEEGFDPNRIAVAFAQDVAALGEMRVQSGLAPLFAPR